MKKAKIIYFVKGFAPKADDFEKASKMNAEVIFRNALISTDSVEDCDGVAGEVPQAYKDKPSAEDAIKKVQKALEKEKSKDEVAPEKKTKATE